MWRKIILSKLKRNPKSENKICTMHIMHKGLFSLCTKSFYESLRKKLHSKKKLKKKKKKL